MNIADYLTQLSKRRIHAGVINEPRAFFDIVTPSTSTLSSGLGERTSGHPGVFRNGEQYPIKLTHMVMCPEWYTSSYSSVTDIEDLQAVQTLALRLIVNGHFYMNRDTIPITAWANVATNVDDSISRSTSTWNFLDRGVPFVLSTRDTLMVSVSRRDLAAAPYAAESYATVVFVGYGLRTQRPYMLSSEVTLEASNPVTFDPDDLRNDGDEPIVVTSMSINHRGPYYYGQVSGDIRRLAVDIRQIGNGTNAQWVTGPIDGLDPADNRRIPCSLLAASAGLALVHQFPEPIMWEPGGGIDIEVQRVGPIEVDTSTSMLNVGLLGHIMVL